MDIEIKARDSEYLGLDQGLEGMTVPKGRSNVTGGIIKE